MFPLTYLDIRYIKDYIMLHWLENEGNLSLVLALYYIPLKHSTSFIGKNGRYIICTSFQIGMYQNIKTLRLCIKLSQ